MPGCRHCVYCPAFEEVGVFTLPPHPIITLLPQVWRNHTGLVEALLEAGADPDAQDAESGWSALHRALHLGQLRSAAALLASNASLGLSDWRGRTPLDLLSAELKEFLRPEEGEGGRDGDVFAWGARSLRLCGAAGVEEEVLLWLQCWWWCCCSCCWVARLRGIAAALQLALLLASLPAGCPACPCCSLRPCLHLHPPHTTD